MFLFDQERSGQVPFDFDFNQIPILEWQLNFKQLPTRCAESTPVLDEDGNGYFGSHDGCFYCVAPNGQIKWQFVTDTKVYSSPLISGNRIYFNCNMFNTVCLDLNGNLIWQFDSYKVLIQYSKIKRIFLNLYSYLQYDYEFKSFMKINAWSSPNLLQEKYIVTVLYGIGIVVLDKENGSVFWNYDFGKPINHLAGVAITKHNGAEIIAAIGQNSGLHLFDASGKLLWKNKAKFRTNAWANPSVDKDSQCIYYSESFKNKYAILYKCDYEGKVLWQRSFNFGCRATVAISQLNFVVFLGLDGIVYYLDKNNGETLFSKKIASSDRGLWTNAAVLPNGNVLINTKKSVKKGSLICLSKTMEVLWEIEYGKALSVPMIDQKGNLYTATWNGDFFKYKSV